MTISIAITQEKIIKELISLFFTLILLIFIVTILILLVFQIYTPTNVKRGTRIFFIVAILIMMIPIFFDAVKDFGDLTGFFFPNFRFLIEFDNVERIFYLIGGILVVISLFYQFLFGRQIEIKYSLIQSRYKNLVDKSEVGIISISLDGVIYYCNPKISKFLDYPIKNLLNSNIMDWIYFDDQESFKSALNHIKNRTSISTDTEFRFKSKTENFIWVNAVFTPIFGSDKIKEIHCYLWDTTEEKKVNELKENLIAMTSHELRTPLTVLKGYNDFLLKHIDLPSATRIHVHKSINRSIAKLGKLTNNVTEYAKVQAGILSISPHLIRMSVFLTTVYEEISVLYSNRFITLNNENINLEKQYYFDSDRVLQIIHNLISNGIKNSRFNNAVELSIGIKDNHILLIQVQDYGVGIPSSRIFTLFQPFTHYSTEFSHEGLGLGLYIVKRIVDSFDGSIEVYTDPDSGTLFRVSLSISSSLNY